MPKNIVIFVLGIALVILGVFGAVNGGTLSVIPLIIGASLIFFSWHGGKTGLVIFGHGCIIIGCFLITWGIYLLPYSEPTFINILTRPLFWGLFSLMGGVCANFHGFCRCMRQ